MKVVIRRGPDAVLSRVFGLLLLTLLTNILFASTPLPLGGPNVILAATSVLVLSIYILTKSHRIDDWNCIAIVLVASALMVWAALVHLFTDTPGYTRIGQIAMGIGMLCVTYMATTTPGRANLIVQATVLATSLSALFGFGVIYASDIFWPLWRAIVDAGPHEIKNLINGRLAGLSNGQSTIASQIAVAVPFVLAMWIHNQPQSRMRSAAWNLALFLLLLLLFWAALATGYRALLPALFVGAIVVVFTSTFVSPELKSLIFRKLSVIALAAAVGSALLLASGSDAWQRRDATVPALADPLPGSASCAKSLGRLSEPVSVSDIWSRDCKSRQNPRQYARYYTLNLERETPLDIRVNSANARLYMKLHSGWRPDSKELYRVNEGFVEIRRTEVLAPGKYTIEVATDKNGAGKRFRLRTRSDLSSVGAVNIIDRYMKLTNVPAQHRLHMFSVAYRYFLDHPLGTGGFFPAERHLRQHWSQALRRDFMQLDLHNHFLLVLTHYGLPGLILLICFCGGILWSVVRSIRLARRAPSVPGAFLLSAVVGALTVYWLFRLFNPVGPFHTDWHHFILVGLALGMPRILSLQSRTSVTRKNRNIAKYSTINLVFTLLLATICSYIWLGTAPLPLGGPDVILAVLTGLLSLACLLVAAIRKPVVVSVEFLILIGASLGILSISISLHLYFGTNFTLMREVIWIMMGIGVLLATWLTVGNTRRITLLIGAFVLAVFVSALFGLVDALVLDFMQNTHSSRIGGLTTHIHFGGQVAVAVPLMFAFFLHNIRHNVFRLTARGNFLLNAVLGIALAVLIVALLMNGSRAGILGSVAGMTVATFLSLAHRPMIQRRTVAVLLVMGTVGSSVLLASYGEWWKLDARLFSYSDSSALARIRYIDDTLRHAVSNPWGTAPTRIQLAAQTASPIVEVDKRSPKTGQWVTLMATPANHFFDSKASYQWQTRTRYGWTDISSHATINQFCSRPDGCRRTFRVVVDYDGIGRRAREITVVWRGEEQSSVVESAQITFTPEQLFGGDILPHNQALEILARYGFPGLALFVIFCIVAIRPLYLAGRSALRHDDDGAMFAVIMISAAVTSYFVKGLFHPTNPFSGHWYLFFLFGMIPAVRILSSGKSVPD